MRKRELSDGQGCSVALENELGKHLARCIPKAEHEVFLGSFSRTKLAQASIILCCPERKGFLTEAGKQKLIFVCI